MKLFSYKSLLLLTTFLGIGHHIEHILRPDIGWPLNGDVNPFSYSLLIYPFIILGYFLSRRKYNYLYWGFVALAGFVLVGFTHLGIISDESFLHILEMYNYSVSGYIALIEVVGLLISLMVLFFVSIYLFWKTKNK